MTNQNAMALSLAIFAALAIGLFAGLAQAADPTDAAPEGAQIWAVHAQATVVDQAHPGFTSPYEGPNSLGAQANGRETMDVTLFAGVRPWADAEFWVNPEIDQGFGLGNTLGVAGFPSGEAYKVGKATPYARLQRLFLRQTIDLGGNRADVDADLNQLRGHQTDDRLVITVGKFGVTDIFDANTYAHDTKHDFLNWGVIDAGTFDYAADAWGYTVGAAVEWYQGPWTIRLGAFDLSDVPNSPHLDGGFGQFQMIAEIERRFTISGQPGALKATGFITRGRMGRYLDAIALAAETGATPDVALVRAYRGRGGLSLNLQQQISADLGVFARAGFAGGSAEAYEFSDIDRTISGGVQLKGRAWRRAADTVGLAFEINGISRIHQQYLALGGLGILVGDGRLPRPGEEAILETYYDVPVGRFVHVGVDYQFVNNPAYNRDRGPVSIFAARLHAQF
jgi:high affinity Mn2+ porin